MHNLSVVANFTQSSLSIIMLFSVFSAAVLAFPWDQAPPPSPPPPAYELHESGFRWKVYPGMATIGPDGHVTGSSYGQRHSEVSDPVDCQALCAKEHVCTGFVLHTMGQGALKRHDCYYRGGPPEAMWASAQLACDSCTLYVLKGHVGIEPMLWAVALLVPLATACLITRRWWVRRSSSAASTVPVRQTKDTAKASPPRAAAPQQPSAKPPRPAAQQPVSKPKTSAKPTTTTTAAAYATAAVPPAYRSTFENLCQRFPELPLATVLEAVTAAEGHGGVAVKMLRKPDCGKAPAATSAAAPTTTVAAAASRAASAEASPSSVDEVERHLAEQQRRWAERRTTTPATAKSTVAGSSAVAPSKPAAPTATEPAASPRSVAEVERRLADQQRRWAERRQASSVRKSRASSAELV